MAITIEKEVKSSSRTWQGLLPPKSKEDFRPAARLRDEGSSVSRPHLYQQPWRASRFGIPKTFAASPMWGSFKEIDPRAFVNVGELHSTSAIAPPYGAVRLRTDLDQWPRLLQMLSIALLIGSTMLSTGEILSAAGGLLLGFIALTTLFFANYAAWRRGVPGFIGPHVSMLGTACSLTISVAIVVNLIVS